MHKRGYEYIDSNGSFRMVHPENSSYLYFPLAGDSGLKSCVTPLLGGDSKLDQNAFLLRPVSVEDLHNLKSVRNFWCKIRGGGVWSAVGGSAESEALRATELEEETVLEAGLMWHCIHRESPKYRLSSRITSFVPNDDETIEIMQVSVCNHRDEPVTITPVVAIPLYGRSADNLRDHRHVTSLLHRVQVVDGGMELTPTLTFDERGHKKNTKTYFVYATDEAGALPRSVCPLVQDFIGEGGSFSKPQAIYGDDERIWLKPGTSVAGGESVAALRFDDVTLQSGESRTWCVYMGITRREHAEASRNAVLNRYGGKQKTDAALERLKKEWVDKVNVHYRSADPDWDNYMYWVTFQPILRRMFGCSFLPYHDYGKGGRGWRDLWQDCLALLIMEPDGVREKLIDYYGGVRMDGTNATIIGEKQGQFIADRNHIVRVWMDHGFWPFQTTQMYIQQTGDMDILLEKAPYFKDKQIFRGERTDMLWREEQGVSQRDEAGQVVSGTLLEHILLQNVTAFFDVGSHNHIRLRGADWNDAFDMAVRNGESVTFTAAYAGNLEQIAILLRKLAAEKSGCAAVHFHKEVCFLLEDHRDIYDSIEQKQALLRNFYESCEHTVSGEMQEVSLTQLADTLDGMAQWIHGHIRRTEWVQTPEGSFYNGYYDDHCHQLEGNTPNGTQMGLTSQVFPLMFGTVTDEQVEQIVRSADKLLYREDLGGYRLNTDIREVKDDMGRAYGFAYGHKENGAVFSHMSVMYANALYRRGFIKEGYKALHALYRQSVNFEKSRIYPGIPEYFSDTGRGMYAYLTGSASWLMMTVVTQMYGIRGRYGDLAVEPKLLREQLDEKGTAGICLDFAGVSLSVRYEARDRQEVYCGVKELYLDGEKISGSVIPRAQLTAGCTRRREIRVIL